MQGGEPLSVRSSAKRVKRGTVRRQQPATVHPLHHHNLPGFGVGPGPARAIGGIGSACLGLPEYMGAKRGYALGLERTQEYVLTTRGARCRVASCELPDRRRCNQ